VASAAGTASEHFAFRKTLAGASLKGQFLVGTPNASGNSIDSGTEAMRQRTRAELRHGLSIHLNVLHSSP